MSRLLSQFRVHWLPLAPREGREYVPSGEGGYSTPRLKFEKQLSLITILLLAIAVSAFAEEPAPIGLDRYIVVLQGTRAGDSASFAKEAEKLGAHVEANLGNRMIIAAPSATIDALRRHASVKYVQSAVVGARPDRERIGELEATSVSQLPIESHSGQTWTTGDYAYDGAGNIASIASATAPGTQGWRIYSYDSVTRLSKAQIRGVTPTVTYEYSYDAYGNRTAYAINGTPISVSVSSATNRLTDATYDTRGNQLVRGATVATYDGFDMVTSYRFDASNNNVETYVYTASDERIGVLRGTEWTWSLRDDKGLVLRQYRSSSTNPTAAWLWVEDFVFRNGVLLGSERVAEEGGRRHYHLDHLGSPRLVTGSNGSLISEHDFLPFGEERTTIGQHRARGFDREEPLRFTGHERNFDIPNPNDSSAYIDYMHARYYAAKTGRFLSVDPYLDITANMGTPQRWNRYAYSINNPINIVDPDGRDVVYADDYSREAVEATRKISPGTDAVIREFEQDKTRILTYSTGDAPDIGRGRRIGQTATRIESDPDAKPRVFIVILDEKDIKATDADRRFVVIHETVGHVKPNSERSTKNQGTPKKREKKAQRLTAEEIRKIPKKDRPKVPKDQQQP